MIELLDIFIIGTIQGGLKKFEIFNANPSFTHLKERNIPQGKFALEWRLSALKVPEETR